MLDRMGPDQAKMMPREVVLKKLRERNEPIILFGETEAESFFRLRKLELGCQEQYKIKGWTNEIKVFFGTFVLLKTTQILIRMQWKPWMARIMLF